MSKRKRRKFSAESKAEIGDCQEFDAVGEIMQQGQQKVKPAF